MTPSRATKAVLSMLCFSFVDKIEAFLDDDARRHGTDEQQIYFKANFHHSAEDIFVEAIFAGFSF